MELIQLLHLQTECPATPADKEDNKFLELEVTLNQWMDSESVAQALDQAAKVSEIK